MRQLIKKILREELLQEKFKVGEDEYIKLYGEEKTDDFLLVVPLTHNASCKYGASTKWCTTSTNDDEDFKNHIGLGVLAYIIVRDERLTERLNNRKFALYRLFTDGPGRTIVFDELNNEYKNGEEWLSNEFDKVDELSEYFKIMRRFNDYFDIKKSYH
jgi:hypothetical protein